MARSRKPQKTLDILSFVTPEQKLLRFLLSEPTTYFSSRVLSSRLKGVRGLGGLEGILKILRQLEELGMVRFVHNDREVCIQNDHVAVKILKVFVSICDLEDLRHLLEGMTSKCILYGDRALGNATSDSPYQLYLVSETPQEVERVIQGHRLGKRIVFQMVTPDQSLKIEESDAVLSKLLDQGIVLWGSTW